MKKLCLCDRRELGNTMRKLWTQHVYWTRFFIISTVQEIPDLKYVTSRLLKNPEDFAKVLKIFYGEKTANEFKQLLTEHLKIGGDLVNAAKNAEVLQCDELRKKWYANADDIAEFLAEINPYWCQEKWKDMLYSHLNMTEKEVGFRLKKEYSNDIDIFEVIEKEALDMGDHMAFGIIRQFCCN